MKNKKLIVGITGASGSIYAVRLLKALLEKDFQIDLIISDYGEKVLSEELGYNASKETFTGFLHKNLKKLPQKEMAITRHDFGHLAAPIASGSYKTGGMVVIPCSMKSLAGIAGGLSRNLIERSADVTLKERRPLIVVPRETPLNAIHIKNMLSISEAGGTILPAMPAFYHKPEKIIDLADFITGKILNILHIQNQMIPPWE